MYLCLVEFAADLELVNCVLVVRSEEVLSCPVHTDIDRAIDHGLICAGLRSLLWNGISSSHCEG